MNKIDSMSAAVREVIDARKGEINMYEKPFGIKEAMEFTGYSRAYIYQLIHYGQIPCHKPTGGKRSRVFFKPSELAEFIYRNKKAADYELSEKADDILNGEAQ